MCGLQQRYKRSGFSGHMAPLSRSNGWQITEASSYLKSFFRPEKAKRAWLPGTEWPLSTRGEAKRAWAAS